MQKARDHSSSPKIGHMSQDGPYAQSLNFQMQVNNTSQSKTHKPSPKSGNSQQSYIQKQNPFKGATAAAQGMQQHVQFVNQPHHLVMPGHSGALSDELLSLQQLYPTSQSPMSFKQMQNAKRQKRNNQSFVGSSQPAR